MVETQIAIGIMAHHSRWQQAARLAEEVGADTVTIDQFNRGENATGNAVWSDLYEIGDEWSIVLQDDALPVDNFRHHAAAALAVAPKTAVSFYVGTFRPRAKPVLEAVNHAEEIGATWLEADNMLWGVAIAMPTDMIPDYLEWSNRATDYDYDVRIGHWFGRLGLPIRYTWPSLVDHADGVSLVQNRQPRGARVAHRIGVVENWDGPVAQIGHNGVPVRR